MWEAWHSGKNPSGFDVFDNEFGYTYAYYSPVWVNNNEIGLVCADISVKKVNSTIIKNVLYQSAGLAAVLLVSILIMVGLLQKIFLYRIVYLEKNIIRYAESKDETLAGMIRDCEQGNDEIKSLSDQFANMNTELKEYMENLQHVTMEKERISTELSVATQIQADMLPRIFPLFPERKEFALYATMDPAKEVGGDFYDFFMADDDHIALVVADVSGKGVPAATDANDELFGNDRLIAALNKEPEAGVEALLKNVRMEIDRFVKDAPQFDDITMLGFQFYGDGVDDNAEDGRSCGNS